jgi:hypothetical protein
MQIVADGSEEADFTFGTEFSDGNGDGVLVDIETEKECNHFHDGVVVRSRSHDESEHVSHHERAVLAALPIRATRDLK